MNSQTSSVWSIDEAEGADSTLAANATCDVCVIGGGIAGLTAAYVLGRAGKRVVILDAKPALASGETQFTSAHLAWYLDDHFSHLIAVRGEEVAKQAAASHMAAIDFIEETAKRENIGCEFRRVPGHLFEAAHGKRILDDEVAALTRLGLPFERKPLTLPDGRSRDCLEFPNHAQFHPLKYLRGLIAAIRTQGTIIHTRTVVEKVRGGEPCTVTTTHGHTVSAGSVVIATNNPFEGGTSLHSKVAAYLTYVIAVEIPAGSFAPGLYWDTEDPYHFVRTHSSPDGDLLLVGGEDHKTGQAEDQAERWDRLLAWTRTRFPQAGAVRHHWCGQIFETPDGLGLIGLAPWNGPNAYIITGDSGMGLTHGTLGSNLVADLILGRTNPLAAVYSPSRLMPAALRTLLGENLNMASQFRDWLTGGDVASAEEIPNGQGAVIREGLTKRAVYKSEKGELTTLSAVCPHTGALVRWNAGEHTWDCPCHGSRFSATGMCLHGPSTTDLTKIENEPAHSA